MAMSLNEVISSLWSSIKTYLGNNYLSKNGKAASSTVADKATSDASGNTITSTYATKTELSTAVTTANTYADSAVASLVSSAPETLDTLSELATALGNDPNFATTIATQIGTKANSSDLTSHTTNSNIHVTASDKTNWNNKSTFSGSYADLTNKPTIPTVNNATLTIQRNGTTVNSFTANASSNVTANITVPTKTSDLTNDSDYATRANVADSLQEAKNYVGTATSNMVTIDTSQTITGNKAFSGSLDYLVPLNRSEIPTSNTYKNFIYKGQDGSTLCNLQYVSRPDESRDVILYVHDKDGGAHGLRLSTDNYVIPTIANGMTLGTSGTKWLAVYATNFTGDLVGNVTGNCSGTAGGVAWNNVSGKPSTYTPSSHTHNDIYYTETEVNNLLGGKSNTSHTHDDRYYTETEVNNLLSGKANTSGTYSSLTVGNATKATQDASGNVINTTYATKSENALKANDANVVHLTGDESITNKKYFDSPNNSISLVKRITDYATETTPTSNVYQHLAFQDKNNKNLALVQYTSRTSNVRDLDLYIFDASGASYGIQINTNGEVIPSISNTYSLGSTSNKWAQLHCTEITTYTHNFQRNIYSDYGTFWRQDGYNLYLLLTAKGDPTGDFTSARPIQVSMSTGICNINGNANSATYSTTQTASNNSTKIATTAFVKSQGYVSLTSLAGGTTAGTMASAVGTMLFAYISQPTGNYSNVSGSQVYAAIITATSDGIVSMSKSTTTIGVGTWRMLGISAGYYSINYCMVIRVV